MQHQQNTHADGNVEYKCDHCNYQTNQNRSLSQHSRNKHGELNKFQCDKCDESNLTNATSSKDVRNEQKAKYHKGV